MLSVLHEYHLLNTERDVVCCSNWAGFESSTSVTNINQQFTIGTESLNAIIATIRPGNYDSTIFSNGNAIGGTPQATIAGANTFGNAFIPQKGSDPRGINTTEGPIQVPENSVYAWYYTFLSGEKCVGDQFGPLGTWSANYQLNVSTFTYIMFNLFLKILSTLFKTARSPLML